MTHRDRDGLLRDEEGFAIPEAPAPRATEPELVERIVRRRPGTIVPLATSFVLTVHHIGDALVTDGEKLYELGQGKWRLVSEEVYERVMRAALTGPSTPVEANRRRRRH